MESKQSEHCSVYDRYEYDDDFNGVENGSDHDAIHAIVLDLIQCLLKKERKKWTSCLNYLTTCTKSKFYEKSEKYAKEL